MNTKLHTLIVTLNETFANVNREDLHFKACDLHSIIVKVNNTLGVQFIVEEKTIYNDWFDDWEPLGFQVFIWGQYNLGPVYETSDTHLDIELFLNHIKSLNWDELTAQMVNWHEDWYARENPEEVWGQDTFYAVKQFVEGNIS